MFHMYGFKDYKFEIIVDNEFLLKRFSITFNVLDLESNEFQSPLFGPAIIVKYDSNGNTLALTREEVLYVMIFCVYCYENNFFVLLDNQHINRINEMLSILFGNNG